MSGNFDEWVLTNMVDQEAKREQRREKGRIQCEINQWKRVTSAASRMTERAELIALHLENGVRCYYLTTNGVEKRY